MSETTSDHVRDRRIWVRGLYMLFFAIAYSIAELAVMLIAVFQFLAVLFTGGVNDNALRFGRNVAAYMFEILQFETFNDERLPFPFSDWPNEPPAESPWQGDAPTASATGPTPAPAEDEAEIDDLEHDASVEAQRNAYGEDDSEDGGSGRPPGGA